ncbi:MAG TPA: IS4 family transposase [Niabella sp.]|nr:IS4 family transposase [Niabella sp.]HRB28316.1 IS4 family transposase [Niabella sp.]HRB41850.1 IS4 family transposase [Niabella sp.]HRB48440.1 IS4 family transposase [Niabella sp.]HRC06367.1 IS4 family transposase [Niabella sp.]
MNQGKYVFSQIISIISHKQFQTLVRRHNGDYKVKDFTCWKQFLCMVFGQLTHRESLSDTILCLQANSDKLYHLGIGKAVSKSTLSVANENRSYEIYQGLAMLLIKEAKQLYIGDSDLEIALQNNVFAIDATTIDLCLSSFYWATFRSTKAGIKLHTQLDLKTAIPEFIHFSTASVHDVNALDFICFETNSFYIMDRGYVDYKRLYKIHQADAFYITRAKDNMNCRRVKSNPSDKTNGVLCDQYVLLNNYYATKDYPQKIRRIKFYDAESGKTLIFLTNNFHLKATEIAQLYKHRWKIELFFKWIKQHLKIKSFWGQSENAVKTQVWIAVSVYVLVAIAKKKFMLKQSLYEILQILSISIFERMSINQLFQPTQKQYFKELNHNQLSIFE